MVPSGPSTPIGGAHSVPPSLLRSNSGMLAAQGGQMPSQSAFPPLMSPRTQYNTMNLLGNVPNVSSLLSQSLVNGVPSSGFSGQRGGIEPGAEPDPLANGGNGMGFNPSSSSFVPPNMANPNSSNQLQGQHFSSPPSNQILPDQQQLEPQSFQHGQQSLQQLPTSQSCQPQQQQQYQSLRGGFGSVKLEPQVANDHQHGPQQLPSLRNINPVKLEPQQIQSSRNMVPVKMEPQHSDQTSFQQQQQQQFIHMPRQSSQAATAAQINLLHQHRLLQIQQHQQQQLLKAIPQQRSLLPQQFQHAALRSPVKPVFEPGMCARRLTHYMYHQRRREDNSIEFWRKFVGEYFAPNAKKKWCVSMYGSGRQTTTGVFPEDVWHCEICNRKPGRGFEATVEVLPRLFKIKYESGTLEELLYVDMPREYPNASGQYVLDYAKAIQESVFDQLRVVREGRLRIVFSPDLKICSWEFCAWRHEELIPRRLLMPQVSQIAATAKKCHTATQIASSGLSASELQNNCNMFVASARQLTKALEVPLVNDLGYTKRYVRCLQISEVVNSMKDLIDFSRDMEIGPVESLNKYPRRTGSFQNRSQQPEERHLQIQQHHLSHNNTDQNSIQGTIQGITSTSGITSVNNSSASTSTSTIASLLHHHNSNSMNPRQQPNNGTQSPYNGTAIQIPSPGSSSTVQPNPSPFHSPTPSSNNLASPHNMLTPGASHMSGVANPQPNNDGIDPGGESSQNSVQKMIHDLMVSSHANGVMENGVGAAGSVAGQPMMMMNGNRGMNWRMGMVSREQNQASDLSNQLLGGLGSVNGFNNLQFDWKSSP